MCAHEGVTVECDHAVLGKARNREIIDRCLRQAGVFELRNQDQRAWYRVVYWSRMEDVIYVLHCFEKKNREMPRNDFAKARQRFKAVKARLAEEKKREKRR